MLSKSKWVSVDRGDRDSEIWIGQRLLSDFRMVCKITRVGPSTEKKSMFSFWPTWLWLCLQSCTVFTWPVLSSCRNDVFFHLFLFRFVGFWLNKAVEGTTDFASILGGYLSLYVVWGIDFLPSATLMKPLLGFPLGIHLVLITLSYLIWSLFKQEWMLRFASGVCLCTGPFLLVFVFKVKAWLMQLIFAIVFFVQSCWSLWLNPFRSYVEKVIHKGWLTSNKSNKIKG